MSRHRPWALCRDQLDRRRPFGGSGSTLIATEKTGRDARLIEYDPLYCDTIIRRLQVSTGKRAVRAALGACFEDVADERLTLQLEQALRSRNCGRIANCKQMTLEVEGLFCGRAAALRDWLQTSKRLRLDRVRTLE